MLRIRTLGGLSVQAADQAPAGKAIQPRRLAVLAIIGRAGARGVTRDKLLAVLWPDADDEARQPTTSRVASTVRPGDSTRQM